MKLRFSTDFLTALMFLGLGLFALVYGAQYPLGSASRMGAGYFPRLISIGLILVGGILAFRALHSEGESFGTIHWRPLIFILAGTLSFGLLIRSAGLLIAGATLVGLSRLASDDLRPLEIVCLAALLVAAAILLFVYLLGLSIPVLPRW